MEKVYKKEFTTKQLLKNASGHRKLERTYLDYSQAIIHSLSFDTSIINPLLRKLNMSEEELFQRLSGSISSNISFFDQSLSFIYQYLDEKNDYKIK